MSSHLEAVRRNILPLSKAHTLPGAFREWQFSGKTRDHEGSIATCELCEQEELRYQFEITNSGTHRRLWVGSQCILKFGVAVYEGAARLTPTQTKKKLTSLMAQMRLESCLKALHRLADAEDNDILRNALQYYKEHNHLTPKFAFVVLWRLAEHQIDHSPSFFKISLRRDKYQEDLRNMPSARVHRIWPALTISQRKLAVSLSHSPPAVMQ